VCAEFLGCDEDESSHEACVGLRQLDEASLQALLVHASSHSHSHSSLSQRNHASRASAMSHQESQTADDYGALQKRLATCTVRMHAMLAAIPAAISKGGDDEDVLDVLQRSVERLATDVWSRVGEAERIAAEHQEKWSVMKETVEKSERQRSEEKTRREKAESELETILMRYSAEEARAQEASTLRDEDRIAFLRVIAERDAELIRLRSECQMRLDEQTRSSDAALAALQEECAAAKHECAALTAQYGSLVRDSEGLIQEHRADVDEWAKQAATEKETHARVVAELEVQIRQLQQTVREQTSELAAQGEQRDGLQAELDCLKRERDEAEQKQVAAEGKQADAEARCKDALAKHAAEKSEILAAHRAFRAEISDLEQKLEKAISEKGILDMRLADVTRDSSVTRQQCDAQLRLLRQENEALQQKLVQQSEQLQQFTDKQSRIEVSTVDDSQQSKALEAVETLEAQLRQVQEEKDKVSAENVRLLAQLERMFKAHADETEMYVAEIEALRSKR
jgi:chromosome segregation ATPase